MSILSKVWDRQKRGTQGCTCGVRCICRVRTCHTRGASYGSLFTGLALFTLLADGKSETKEIETLIDNSRYRFIRLREGPPQLVAQGRQLPAHSLAPACTTLPTDQKYGISPNGVSPNGMSPNGISLAQRCVA